MTSKNLRRSSIKDRGDFIKWNLKVSAIIATTLIASILSASIASADSFTNNQVGDEARYLALNHIGVDPDGYFGFQCVDLPNHEAQIHLGYRLGGNAIDLLDSAKRAGLKVRYAGQGYKPLKGAIFVKHSFISGFDYGHTGILTDNPDTNNNVEVAEQNAGDDSNLYYGTPPRLAVYNINDFVGWYYLTNKQ